MNRRNAIAALGAASLLTMSGCAVMRGQSSAGEYVDDAAITTAVKAKMVEDRQVDAAAIKVETLQGTVMLSGFARNTTERVRAEQIAHSVKGVRTVRNAIEVRP